MELKIASDLEKIKEVSAKILQCLHKRQLSEPFLFDVKLACEEAVINAIKYGNKSQANLSVSIKCEITPEAVVITVEDQGQGFDYKVLPDPTKEENLSKTKGRGLFLIHKAMDKVEFNDLGNKITMTKFLEGGKRCR